MNEVDKRMDGTEHEMGYAKIEELPDNWRSYPVQKIVNADGAPTEQVIRLITTSIGRDIAIADDKLVQKQASLVKNGLEQKAQAPNTVSYQEYEIMDDVDLMEF